MELFTLVAKFVADTKGFVNGVSKAKDTMDKGRSAGEKLEKTLGKVKDTMDKGRGAGEKLEKTLGKLKAAFAAVVSVAAIKKVADGLMGLAKAAANAGDRVDKQSQALGMSRKAYQEWDYILGQSGASIDSMGVSMKTLNAAILSGSAEAAEALDSIGLSAKSLGGMSQEQAFETVVKAFQRLPSSAKKSADAVKLFGRNGQELMPLLNTTTEGMDALRQEANALGMVMSDSMIDSGVKFGDSLDRMSKTAQGLKNVLGYGLQEGLTKIFDKVTQFMGQQETQDAIARFSLFLNRLGNATADGVSAVFDWLIEHSGDIEEAFGSVTSFFTDLLGFIEENGPIVAALGVLLGLVTGFFTPLRTTIILVGLIAANWGKIKTAAGEAKKAVTDFLDKKSEQGTNWIKERLQNLANDLSGFESNVDASRAKVRAFFNQGLPERFNTVVETVKTKWGEIKDSVSTTKEGIETFFGGGELNLDVPPWVASVLYVIRDAWNSITQAVNRAKNWVSNFIEKLDFKPPKWVSSVLGVVSGAFRQVVTWAQAAINKVREFFGVRDSGSISIPDTSGLTSDDMNERLNAWNDIDALWNNNGNGYATGLNRVPWDNFPARLHKGEAVLTRTEAEQWRSGGTQTVDAAAIGQAVASAVAQALSGMAVVMDGQTTGRVVAQTVGRELERASRAGRFAPV